MSWIVSISAVLLLVAYWVYGRTLNRLLRVNPVAVTPAHALRDDVDYAPLARSSLLSQHFSAIAAAGPIVGPILAGMMFGWLPALLWILVGSIFVGGVHDFTALVASVRHRGQSIAEVVQEHMSRRAYLLFLSFVWLALVYIIVAFTDITASSFVGRQTLENGETVSGGAIATSSLLYLALPVAMGLLVRFTKLTMGWATVIFLPLVGLSIWAGPSMPIDVADLIRGYSTGMSEAEAERMARIAWDVALLLYCAIASVVPLWLLLQPRGQLGGYFLFVALAAGAMGMLFDGQVTVQYPAFIGWTSAGGEPLLPILFITIACGACSGFHSLIASGTTSKQLRTEADARPIGYGAMLLEGLVAIISLSCVMMFAPGSAAVKNQTPNFVYAMGIGTYLEDLFRIPRTFAISFALMAFTTFVYDTLDVCARLGRFIIQELTGLRDARGRWLGTALTVGAPILFVFRTMTDATGAPVPVWRAFWSLFGASNQLLAALTLLGVTVWLWRTRGEVWVWFVTGIPTVFMYVMSSLALIRVTWRQFHPAGPEGPMAWGDPVAWAGVCLTVLAGLMLLEGIRAIFGNRPARPARADRTSLAGDLSGA